MNMSLTTELDKLVTSAFELLPEAPRQLERKEMPAKERLEEFNRDLKARIDALDRGEHVSANEALQYFRRKSAQRTAELGIGQRHS